MAAHLRRQIRDAFVVALRGLPLTGSNVFKGRSWPTEDASLPALLVYAHGGDPVGNSAYDSMASSDADIPLERDERVTVEGICRTAGIDPDDTLDDIALAVEPALLKAAGLKALVDRLELVSTAIATESGGEKRRGSIKLTYRVVFTTPAGSPDTKV